MMTGDDDGDDNDYNGKVAEALLPDYWAAKGSHTWSMLHYWSDNHGRRHLCHNHLHVDLPRLMMAI